MFLLESDSFFWPEIEDDSSLFLHKLAVLPELQGKGIGNKMLEWASGYTKRQGKSWLRLDCHGGRPKLRQIYETKKPLAKATEYSIQSFEPLLKELRKVRKNNVAYGDEEAIVGVFAVGAPIRNLPGRASVALSIAGPKERMKKNLTEYTGLIIRASDRVSGSFSNNRKCHWQVPG